MFLNTKALMKYILEGLAVAVVSYMILEDRIKQEEIMMIALTAAATFAILDTLRSFPLKIFDPWPKS